MRVRQYNNIPKFSLNIILKVDYSGNVIVKNIYKHIFYGSIAFW